MVFQKIIKIFSLEKQKDGTCHDVVRITSATDNFEKKEVLHELCGLRSLQTLTFESNIILEFESDNAVEDAGFFAEVFTMSKFFWSCLFAVFIFSKAVDFELWDEEG
jgi:hypothetical protein